MAEQIATSILKVYYFARVFIYILCCFAVSFRSDIGKNDDDVDGDDNDDSVTPQIFLVNKLSRLFVFHVLLICAVNT